MAPKIQTNENKYEYQYKCKINTEPGAPVKHVGVHHDGVVVGQPEPVHVHVLEELVQPVHRRPPVATPVHVDHVEDPRHEEQPVVDPVPVGKGPLQLLLDGPGVLDGPDDCRVDELPLRPLRDVSVGGDVVSALPGRAGHFRYFFIFSRIKNDFIAFKKSN